MSEVSIRQDSLFRVSRFVPWLPGPVSPLTLYWLAFIGSVACFILQHVTHAWPTPVFIGLGVASSVTCGLAWLLARALFRPSDKGTYWPHMLVGFLFFCTMAVSFAPRSVPSVALHYLESLQMLIGSAMLILIALEALSAPATEAQDRTLKHGFILVYLAILAIAMAARLPDLSEWKTVIQVSLSIIGAVGATLAVRYRFTYAARGSADAKASDPELAARLLRLMEEEALYRQPGLKVSDLARYTNEPDYQISRAIVQTLGQANFNQWINSYRISEAITRLSAPDAQTISILTLSLDCGFNSLGPFNRAFKTETGLTPTQFRRQAQSANAA